VGLGLAILATIASFVVSQTDLLWPPGVPVGLVVLAFAQIGSAPRVLSSPRQRGRQYQQYLALAFGLLVVFPRHHWLRLDHFQSQRQH